MRIMSMTLLLFVTQTTTTPDRSTPEYVSVSGLPFIIHPVTGIFTAGQTVKATGGLIAPFPLQLELLDEGDTRPLLSTPLRLNLEDGLEPFSFVVPTTLSASNLIVLVEAEVDGITLTSTVGSISITTTSAATSLTATVASVSSTNPLDSSTTTTKVSSGITSTTSASVTGHPSPFSSSSSQANPSKMTNLGAIIGGTVGAAIVILAAFALRLWNRRKRKSLAQKIPVHGDVDKPLDLVSRPFEVNDRVEGPNALVSPFQEPNESPPNLEQKMRPLAPPLILKHLISDIVNDGSSSLQVNLEETGRRRRRRKPKTGSLKKKPDSILPSTEGDDNQAEVLPPEHQAESSLKSAEAPEHVEEILHQPDMITYRHQDSGWRDPVEFRSGRDQTVEGGGVIELPPNYSEA